MNTSRIRYSPARASPRPARICGAVTSWFNLSGIQVNRTGLDAWPAAYTRAFGYIRRVRAVYQQYAAGCLYDWHIQPAYRLTHHRATRYDLNRIVGHAAALLDQLTECHADSRAQIGGGGYVAGYRDYALHNRPAGRNCVAQRRRGRYIHDYAPRVHGQLARGHLPPGHGLNELLFAALRVLDHERLYDKRRVGDCLNHRLNCIGLVFLNRDYAVCRARYAHCVFKPVHNGRTVFQHHAVVTGQKRLALRSVQYYIIDRLFCGRTQFYRGRERRAAQPDDTLFAGVGGQLLRASWTERPQAVRANCPIRP